MLIKRWHGSPTCFRAFELIFLAWLDHARGDQDSKIAVTRYTLKHRSIHMKSRWNSLPKVGKDLRFLDSLSDDNKFINVVLNMLKNLRSR